MGFKDFIFKKSLWVFHFGGASCNNCDIEILDCLTPRHDLERFGIKLVGSIRHADVLLVNGSINKKDKDRLERLYQQAPKPILVVAIGACGCSGGIFSDSLFFAGPVNRIIPVDAYIPGCPPKPEAIIAGIVKLANAKKGRKKQNEKVL
ncbi:NADH-quinone oxidoreductase subunit B family protein [Hyphobacterium sp. CCMP332]|nr:NADH-quinone oxidoreductase subunit B family protein [Hyphobacterium sp. CCMP332]